MCIPYIKLLDDPPPPPPSRKRSRTSNTKFPMASESAHPNPIIVELSPRLVYAPSTSRSNSHRGPTHPRRRPSAPHPSPATPPPPQAEFVGGFEAGYPLSHEEQEQRRLAAEGTEIEEGRAGPSGTGPPQPQLQQPLVGDPGQYSQPQTAPQACPPPVQQAPALQSQPVPTVPAVAAPQRAETRSPYSYIRRPPPHYRNRSRSRSRSSSDSSVSRRSFEALRRRVHALTDRLTRLERWKDDVVSERLGRLERWKGERETEARERARSTVRTWSLGPARGRRAEGRVRDRNVDERRDTRTDGREERGRWDWEGGGLGRR
ncbi:hypothetical protein N7G274_010136 [Stereocaulon virgatum]|uniref:Uncharacterized protein n=1 Tax=Stereocaulon virgatum TaxID=373712 RepID=A0ABR3ZWM1_9LECA